MHDAEESACQLLEYPQRCAIPALRIAYATVNANANTTDYYANEEMRTPCLKVT